MEMVDIVDENDQVVGKADREMVHANPKLIHHTVHFTLIDQHSKKIFLSQRSFTKSHDPGKLCFLGEHILSGETYDQAIKRGVQEELGFTPKEFIEIAHHIFSYQTQTEFIRFFLVYWENEIITVDKDEIINTFWLTPTELKRDKNTFSEMTQYWVDQIVDFKFLQ